MTTKKVATPTHARGEELSLCQRGTSRPKKRLLPIPHRFPTLAGPNISLIFLFCRNSSDLFVQPVETDTFQEAVETLIVALLPCSPPRARMAPSRDCLYLYLKYICWAGYIVVGKYDMYGTVYPAELVDPSSLFIFSRNSNSSGVANLPYRFGAYFGGDNGPTYSKESARGGCSFPGSYGR